MPGQHFAASPAIPRGKDKEINDVAEDTRVFGITRRPIVGRDTTESKTTKRNQEVKVDGCNATHCTV